MQFNRMFFKNCYSIDGAISDCNLRMFFNTLLKNSPFLHVKSPTSIHCYIGAFYGGVLIIITSTKKKKGKRNKYLFKLHVYFLLLLNTVLI